MEMIKENLKRHLTYLCHECPSRHCGSPTEAKAADYIEAEFKKLGYDTVREYYPTVGWEFKEFSLYNVTKGHEGPATCAAYFSNSVDIETKFTVIRGEDLARLDEMDLMGKLVLVAVVRIGGTGLFRGGNALVEKLDKLGAAGAVFISNGHGDRYPSTKMPRSPFLEQIGVATASFDGLIDITRNIDDVYRLKIVAKKFDHMSCNVIARHVGTNGMKGVIGGHYDTAPHIEGADDDGSGVVTTLELARLMKDKYSDWSFDFCAFSAEEYIPAHDGLELLPEMLPPGSGDYAARHKDENIKWLLNIDGTTCAFGDKVLSVHFAEKLPKLDVEYYMYDDKVTAGDDKSFVYYGFPTVWLKSIGPYCLVHTEGDTVDLVSFDRMEEYTRVYADLFRQLAEGKYE